MLSSSAHRFSSIHPEDYNFEKTPYNDWVAYGQAKTSNLYMSNAIERYYGSKGLHSLAVHPGVIQTELSRHLSPEFLAQLGQDTRLVPHLKSIEQGAATTVLAAISKEYEGVGGKCLEDVGEWGPVQVENPAYEPGYASWAFDSGKEDQLWKDSLKFVGLEED